MGLTLRDLFDPPPITTPADDPLPTQCMHMCTNTQFPNAEDWIIDAYPSDAFVKLHKSDRVCQNVCVSSGLCACHTHWVFQNPPPPHHHRKHVLSSPTFIINSICCFPPSFSLSPSPSFHSPRDPELTNTQTVSDVKQWTRRAFRPLALTVEGIECRRLWGGHASLNRQ